jgi:protein involved in polysaccharide export with SLBB domain
MAIGLFIAKPVGVNAQEPNQQQNNQAEPTFVIGCVNKPVELSLPLNLTRAIHLAGGATREANTKRVMIWRMKVGQPAPIKIEINLEAVTKRRVSDPALELWKLDVSATNMVITVDC